jgi:hypothetical protein
MTRLVCVRLFPSVGEYVFSERTHLVRVSSSGTGVADLDRLPTLCGLRLQTATTTGPTGDRHGFRRAGMRGPFCQSCLMLSRGDRIEPTARDARTVREP